MTHLSLPRRPSAGPRALVVVTAAIILLCIALIYTRHGSHPSYLFFFLLPVAAAAVVLGAWVGLSGVLAGFEQGETTAILVVWAVFLLAVAWVVGWVSERGGSLSLTQGLGGRAIRAIEEERRRTGQDIHDGIAQYAAATIFGKLGVRNRTQAAASAIAMGLTSRRASGGPESSPR